MEGGVTWQELLRRDYPASQLTASSAAGFRHAYLMQATHTVEELCCFLTKASFDEQVRQSHALCCALRVHLYHSDSMSNMVTQCYTSDFRRSRQPKHYVR